MSLCNQVSEAKQRGYDDEEICFAIRKAVVPASELKGYLDTLHGKVDLSELLACVKSSYQEKPASALFQDLNKLCQNSTENAQAFLFRALGLRQKVIAASNADADIKYDAMLVNATFLHAVLTGIKSEAIRTHMKPYLEQSRRTKDKELIEEMRKASAEECERRSKMYTDEPVYDRRDTRQVHVQEVSSGLEQMVQPLAEQIAAMGEQMRELKTELVEIKR